jgi:hypothetical protein
MCVVAMTTSTGFAGRASQFSRKSKTTPRSAETTRPDGTVVPGDQIVHSNGTINRKVMATSMARANGDRSPIPIKETMEKDVKVYRTQDITLIDTKTSLRASDEVTVPRMSNEEFQSILKRYQKGMDQPIITKKSPITTGADSVSLDDINKYSDPAESIDKENIPVVPAGGEEAKP